MTDAIAAGQQPAGSFNSVIRTIGVPIYIYFVAWPYVKGLLGMEPPTPPTEEELAA